jgi:RNA polymerase sigma factor (sigma-70 family)
MTDREIIAAIQNGKLEKPIQFLYKEYPKIRLFLIQEGGNDAIIQEIFNDSLVLLIEKVSAPSFELTAKLTTYLTGVNRFLLKNEMRKKANEPFISAEFQSDLFEAIPNFEYDFEKEEQLKRVDTILDTIQEKCKQILHFFYFEKKNMDFIAKQLGFSSVQSAKTQKYKCLEKAHKMANETSIHLENPVL